MDKASRKTAAAAWKMRRATAGIYALRSQIDGQTWVGATRDIDAQRRQTDFALAHGGFLNRTLNEGVRMHGSAAFLFEVLETLKEPEEGLDAYTSRAWLIERDRFWRQKLGAQTI